MRRLAALLAALALASPAAAFIGSVIIGGFAGTIKLEWTIVEDATIRGYRLSRYNCDRPGRCTTQVAWLPANANPLAAAAEKSYTVIDTAAPGTWTYRLVVQRSHGPSSVYETGPLIIPDPPRCGQVDVCNQAGSSFSGTVIVGTFAPRTVELQWTTDAEDGTVQAYRLSRYDCAAPRHCATEVATVDATGQCGQVMLHSITDAVPAGTWTYVLEVLDSGGRTACTMRLPAPASPASSR